MSSSVISVSGKDINAGSVIAHGSGAQVRLVAHDLFMIADQINPLP